MTDNVVNGMAIDGGVAGEYTDDVLHLLILYSLDT